MSFFFVPGDEHEDLEDLRAVLRTVSGRRVIRRLLNKSNVLGVSFGGDAASTEFNEGLRRVGIWLVEKIEAAVPGELSKLMLESSNDKLAHSATQKGTDDDD